MNAITEAMRNAAFKGFARPAHSIGEALDNALKAAFTVKAQAPIPSVCPSCNPNAPAPYFIRKCERHGGAA